MMDTVDRGNIYWKHRSLELLVFQSRFETIQGPLKDPYIKIWKVLL